MAPQIDDDEPAAILNVVHVIALNVVCSFLIFFAAKALGLSWGIAIGVAWVGGSVFTLCVASVLFWCHTRNDFAEAVPLETALLVPVKVTDPLSIWDIDSLLEENHMILTRQGTTQPRSDIKALCMWLEDAQGDCADAGPDAIATSPEDGDAMELPFIRKERRRKA